MTAGTPLLSIMSLVRFNILPALSDLQQSVRPGCEDQSACVGGVGWPYRVHKLSGDCERAVSDIGQVFSEMLEVVLPTL